MKIEFEGGCCIVEYTGPSQFESHTSIGKIETGKIFSERVR